MGRNSGFGNTQKMFKPYPGRGQNFLVDPDYVLKILDLAQLEPQDGVLEIGAGYGALTIPLSKRVSRLVAIEWDNRLVEFLKGRLIDLSDRASIIQADIMKADLPAILGRFSKPPVIIGNLPYYLATPLIQTLLCLGPHITRMIFMVQKEVAQRITAKPLTKAYGYLSLFVEYFARAECVLDVPPHAFKPRPKVKSTIIRLYPRDKPPVEVRQQGTLFKIIKSAFAHRRKTLVNAIKLDPFFKSANIEQICHSVGLKKNVRAEALTLEDFARLSNTLGRSIIF